MMFRKDKASQTPDHCVHCVYTDDEVAYYMVGTVTEGAGGRGRISHPQAQEKK